MTKKIIDTLTRLPIYVVFMFYFLQFGELTDSDGHILPRKWYNEYKPILETSIQSNDPNILKKKACFIKL